MTTQTHDLQTYVDALQTLADLADRTTDTDPDLPDLAHVVCENPFTWRP